MTVPLVDTLAVRFGPSGFTTLHATSRSPMSPASVPSAAFALSTRVSEFAAIKGGAGLGLKATLATRRMTFTVAVALRVPAVAVTFADPTATAVTEPVVASIVRMFGLSDDHLIFRVVMALPCASSAFAISVRTSPTRKTGTASNATDVTGAKTISVSVVEDPGGNGGVGGVVCSSIGVPSLSRRVSVIPTAHCVDDPLDLLAAQLALFAIESRLDGF